MPSRMTFDDRRRLGLARGVRLQTDPANGEPILLFPEGVLYLSASANDIVRRCDGQSSALTIISALAAEYDVSPETLCSNACLNCISANSWFFPNDFPALFVVGRTDPPLSVALSLLLKSDRPLRWRGAFY